jgi:deoxyribodipyrimidine photo-lyase
MAVQVVWFKRDLRVEDHRPLVEAAAAGEVMPLYVYEPSRLQADDHHLSHFAFAEECLEDLDRRLRARGSRLLRRIGEMPEVLRELHRELPIAGLWSHEETGNALTFDRDRRVAAWCRSENIPWMEYPQHGVFRPHPDRRGWAGRWKRRMNEAVHSAPEALRPAACPETAVAVSATDLEIEGRDRSERQRGGRDHAERTLETFLTERGVDYRRAMSSPLDSWEGCSRLSPYLAFGVLSTREVWLATRRRRRAVEIALKGGEDLDPRWYDSVRSFEKRLHWQSHFMQKLEDEPELEFRNLSRAYDGLRENRDLRRFAAWERGETGFPLIDACMRCLHATGWINFRMRAMLVAFCSYQLWQPWRPTALHLARLFLDYEPGIHYSQVQMQSGTTGINTFRIYSPIKQARDQDPSGAFIRRWIPELAGIPDELLAEPHLLSPIEQIAAGCRIGEDYPHPIIEHGPAYQAARRRMWNVKRRSESRREAERVYERHGSRLPPHRRNH